MRKRILHNSVESSSVHPLRLLSLAIALFLTTPFVSAYSFSAVYEGVTFYYNIIGGNNDEVEVTYEYVNQDSIPYVYSSSYSGNVVIPETVEYNGTKYSVTAIGQDAFCKCSDLTSVTIPSSVTKLDSYAFTQCSGLTSVTIPESVTSIGAMAFYKCTALTTVVFYYNANSDDEYIGFNAFKECSNLSEVYVASKYVPTVNSNAFDYTNDKINMTLHVNPDMKEQFSEAAVWKDFILLTPTGIDGVNGEAVDAPVEYFNLRGVKENNPENGLYIRRQGSTVTKVLR